MGILQLSVRFISDRPPFLTIPKFAMRVLMVLLVIGSIGICQTTSTRFYYLSDVDFLTGNSVPLSAVAGHPYIIAEYNAFGQLDAKSKIDAAGNILGKDIYTYLTSGEIQAITTFGPGNRKMESIVFGMEAKSLEFIRYLYQVDSLPVRGDRYTQILFDNDLPVRYRFHDANRRLYGEIGLLYDSENHVKEQLWIRQPDRRIIRAWSYDTDPLMNITHTVELDSTGKKVFEIFLTADGSEPVFTFPIVKDTLFLREPIVDYYLSGPLDEGTLKFVWSGGVPDPVSIRELRITDPEMRVRGDYRLKPTLKPELKDGSVYRVVFHGRTSRGYPAASVTSNPFVIDRKTPRLKGSMPGVSNEIVVTLEASERLMRAAIEFRPDARQATLESQFYELPDLSIFSGRKTLSIPDEIKLKDETTYQVFVSGTDRAGNHSTPVLIGNLVLDHKAPEIVVIEPLSDRTVRQMMLKFTNSEMLSELRLTVSARGETGTVNQQDVPLPLEFTEKGTHEIDLGTLISCHDSLMYDLSMHGSDLAGNSSDTVQVNRLKLDSTSPLVTVIFPISDSNIKESSISFIVDEALNQGLVVWRRTGGAADPSGPYEIKLTGAALEPGKKTLVALEPSFRLKDGAFYSITISGSDKAGNPSDPVEVSNVLYDASPPELTLLKPVTAKTLNSELISYALTESLKEATLYVFGERGNLLVQHELTGTGLDQGVHDDVELLDRGMLKSGMNYGFRLEGIDWAGNHGESDPVSDVQFDFISPTIRILAPAPNSINSEKSLEIDNSEDLLAGQITFTTLQKNASDPAAKSLDLPTDLLGAGRHKFSIESLNLEESATWLITASGVDRAGNSAVAVSAANVIFDTTPPEVTIGFPSSGLHTRDRSVFYTLSESIVAGKIIWERISGSPDAKAPLTLSLTDAESTFGAHKITDVKDRVSLTSGTVYRLRFQGRDRAGMALTATAVENIAYDFIAPKLVFANPERPGYLTTEFVTYTLSEALASGRLVFRRTGGEIDRESPHIINLTDDELKEGIHRSPVLKSPLVDNAVYTITASGKDDVGNDLVADSLAGYMFDATRPVLTITAPVAGDFIQHSLVSYSNSETLSRAELVWTAVPGTADPQSPHRVELTTSELRAGHFENALLRPKLQLKNGVTYSVSLSGIDRAGNAGEADLVTGLTYDALRPEITVSSPKSKETTRSANIQFGLSEVMAGLKISWESHAADESTQPIEYEFPAGLVDAGPQQLSNRFKPPLVSYRYYTIRINGKDRAGNAASEVVIEEVFFDENPPVFIISEPAVNSLTNIGNFIFSVDEAVVRPEIFLRSNDGKLQALPVRDRLRPDVAQKFDLTFPGSGLKEMQFTDIGIAAADSAGNRSDTAWVNDVRFDFTTPQIAVVAPSSESLFRTFAPRVKWNEPLQSGTLVIKYSTGKIDSVSISADILGKPGENNFDDLDSRITEGIEFTLECRVADLAGNRSKSGRVTGLVRDSSPPVIKISGDQEGKVLTDATLNVSYNEPLTGGMLIWTPASGDSAVQFNWPFPKDKLGTGEHILSVDFAETPLKEGVAYAVSAQAVDRAGNSNTIVLLKNIQYDMNPPLLTLMNPQPNSLINRLSVEFENSEDLQSGRIELVSAAVGTKAGATQSVVLTGANLQAGRHEFKLTEKDARILNGEVYSIRILGEDKAGNSATSEQVSGVRMDTQPPEFKIAYPPADTILSSLKIVWSASENLASGSLEIGKARQSGDKIKIPLEGNQLKAGTHSLAQVERMVSISDGDILTLSITGRDAAGNPASPARMERIRFDNTAPRIQVSQPAENQVMNKLEFSLNFSEELESATITISRIEGVPDPKSPYIIRLAGPELGPGEKTRIKFPGQPELIDGVRYKLEIIGKDFAGNSAQPVAVSGFSLDRVIPEYSISQPIDGEKTSKSEISFMLTDKLDWLEVLFESLPGSPDPISRHSATLTGENLSQGPKLRIPLQFDSPLTDGGRYKIQLTGADRAGNILTGIPMSQILYDTKPPELIATRPSTGSYTNSTVFEWSASEDLSLLRLEIQSGGSKAQAVELAAADKKTGTHSLPLESMLEIVESRPYTIAVTATDLAGNQSNTIRIERVTYDMTPPIVTLDQPVDASWVKAFMVSYSLIETLDSGSVELIRTAGVMDPKSPHRVTLPAALLTTGVHSNVHLADYLSLTDGTEYRVSFSGRDRAGNHSVKQTVSQVTLDRIVPEITLNIPESADFIRKIDLDYNLSEAVEKGSVQWTWQSGKPDPRKTHRYHLKDVEREPGSHKISLAQTVIPLVNGSVYDVVFIVEDKAGNRGEATPAGITFDTDPPVLEMKYPAAGQHFDQQYFELITNELLSFLRITWVDLTANEAHLKFIPKADLNTLNFKIEGAGRGFSFIDGHTYQAKTFAWDLAGNKTDIILADSVVFDVSPPLPTLVQPVAGTTVNSGEVEFRLDEPCQSGTITWTWTSGTPDPASAHEIILKPDQLRAGLNRVGKSAEMNMVEGAVYRLTLTATDLLGNTARPVTADDIRTDFKKPELKITSPVSNSVLTVRELNFTTSESMRSITLLWEQADAAGQIIRSGSYAFPKSMLTAGNHEKAAFTLETQSIGSGTFTLHLQGQDQAGNFGESKKITGIAITNPGE